MYTHELKQAVVDALAAVPGVLQVNYLQFWGEQDLYIEVASRTLETIGAIDAALHAVTAGWRGLRPARLRWRVLDAGEVTPASAVLFDRRTQAA